MVLPCKPLREEGIRSGRQPCSCIWVADDQHRQAGQRVLQMTARVQRCPQTDKLAAQLKLQPRRFYRRLPPGKEPQSQLNSRTAPPAQPQQQQRRDVQVDRQVGCVQPPRPGVQHDEHHHPRQRNVECRIPAGRRQQTAQAAPPKGRRRDAQCRGDLVGSLHRVGLRRGKQNKGRERRHTAARQHPPKARPLAAERPRRQQLEIGQQKIGQQQHIEIYHRFDTPTSPFCRHATTICAGGRENPRTVGCAKS